MGQSLGLQLTIGGSEFIFGGKFTDSMWRASHIQQLL